MSKRVRKFNSAADGLYAELSMLQGVAEGGPRTALIWSADRRSLTLPERFSRSGNFDEISTGSASKGWPVITRRTGGGITPQGPGILNVALAYSVPRKEARSVSASYASICDPLIETFATVGLRASTGAVKGSFCDGDFNLEIEGRKIVGTAQRWRGASVMCHALVLVDIDLDEAVSAAQRLSDGLGLNDMYDTGVHCQLSEFMRREDDPSGQFAGTVAAILSNAGYTIV